jgi:tryptophan halogenase
MSIPDSLQRKLQLFQAHGRLIFEPDALFIEGSWVQVLHGQGLRAKEYQRILDVIKTKDIAKYLDEWRCAIKACVHAMPTHERFIEANCRSPASPA